MVWGEKTNCENSGGKDFTEPMAAVTPTLVGIGAEDD